MTDIVDRRGQSRDGAVTSRRRFLDRNKQHIKKAVEKAISDGGVTDIGKDGTDVTIPKGTMKEPVIHHGDGGKQKRVFPWNKQFKKGDIIPKPQGSGGGGDGSGEGASPDGEGEDDFIFHITEEEFLNYIFDDLELPNLEKKNTEKIIETKMRNAGFTSSGTPSRLDAERSFIQKKQRTIAIDNKLKSDTIKLLEEALGIFKKYSDNPEDVALPLVTSKNERIAVLSEKTGKLKEAFAHAVNPEDSLRLKEIDSEVEKIKTKGKVSERWREDTDLRYRYSQPEPVPSSNAVMFCLMDVSGSMDEEKKNNAKIFYFMLYRFLKKHYKNTEIVFIRHHSVAEEVDEKEFFYGRESGGTTVSTVYEKMLEIVDKRYSTNGYNIYGAQASDGDNERSDRDKSAELLRKVADICQAYFYTEVNEGSYNNDSDTELWTTCRGVARDFEDRFFMGRIRERNDVLQVFRGFFKKKGISAGHSPATAAFKR